jgi:apurinic endonuclease APN1
LASKNPFLLQNAKRSLIDYLNINAQMEGSGVIFHIGSTKGKSFTEVKPQIIAAINEILEKSDSRSILILETSAGAGNTIGDTFEELKDIYQGIKQKKRVGFCLDTAHTFASGYDWNKNPAAIVEEFDKTLGLKNLKVVHLNDSKSGLSSHIDRHENVGQGRLGKETIRQILHLPVFQNLPLILEVPGFANQGTDEKNIKILRELAR